MRDVSATFAALNRLKGVSWTVHRDAGSVAALNAAHAEAQRRGERLTAKFMEGFKRRMRHEQPRRAFDPADVVADDVCWRAYIDLHDRHTVEWVADFLARGAIEAGRWPDLLDALEAHRLREVAE
jgi:hypothetical protein